MPNLRWSFADSHNKLEPGGWARQTTVREMPVATQLACVNMRLKAGAIRELHWHKPAEWGFVLKGRVRITAVDQDGRAFQDDVGEGDLWNFPTGIPHSIQAHEGDGSGSEFLLVFDDGNFTTRTRPSCSPTGWPTSRRMSSPRISAWPKAPSRTSPRRSSTSSNRKCPARSPRIGASAQGRCP